MRAVGAADGLLGQTQLCNEVDVLLQTDVCAHFKQATIGTHLTTKCPREQDLTGVFGYISTRVGYVIVIVWLELPSRGWVLVRRWESSVRCGWTGNARHGMVWSVEGQQRFVVEGELGEQQARSMPRASPQLGVCATAGIS